MGDPGATLLSRLTAAVGESNVLTALADVEPYLVDWRGRYRGAARAIVRPSSTEEVAAVVRICGEEGAAIVPQGGNTSMCGGATPRSADEVVVSLTRMNRVRAIDVDNATITVEAGATLVSVQQAADEAGLFFPLSLAAEGSCTIGGNLSTNAGGTAVLRFGNARDLALGIEVVLADGRVWNGLRELRKDNTGYDLKQLFIGGEGTLGIVTAAVLKLYPSRRTRVTAFAALPDVASAVALLRHMTQAVGDRLTGFELISAFSLLLSRKHHPALPDPLPGHPWYALLQIDDTATQSSAGSLVEEALAAAVEAGVVLDATVAQTQEQADKLWALRENISEGQRREGLNIKHDISLPVSAIPAFLSRAEIALRKALPGVRFVVFGHLGDGNLHYNLSAPEGYDPQAFLSHEPVANRIVYDLVDQARGSFSAEHGIGQLKRAELLRYKSNIEIELMRRIKVAFDPHGLFNAGKVV